MSDLHRLGHGASGRVPETERHPPPCFLKPRRMAGGPISFEVRHPKVTKGIAMGIAPAVTSANAK
jgi:hypothetical protein